MRLASDLDQMSLANRAGMDRKTVYRIENATHHVRLRYYVRIAFALSMPLQCLVGDCNHGIGHSHDAFTSPSRPPAP